MEDKLNALKRIIDEKHYPFFSDRELLNCLEEEGDVYKVAIPLLLKKSAMPEIKLGDVTISPPKDYFLGLVEECKRSVGSQDERQSFKKVAMRYDGRD